MNSEAFTPKDDFSDTSGKNLRWNNLAKSMIDVSASLLVRSAYDLAHVAHLGVSRKTGDPYITHPEGVALILYEKLQIRDEAMLAAALLHDVPEDTKALGDTQDWSNTRSQSEYRQLLEDLYGGKTARLVMGVSKAKIDGLEVKTKQDRDVLFIAHFAEEQDDVLVVKLADIYQNYPTRSLLGNAETVYTAEIREFYLPLFRQRLLQTYPRVRPLLEEMEQALSQKILPSEDIMEQTNL